MTNRPSDEQLAGRYGRIADQLRKLYVDVADPLARMGSAAALLHHKMPHFFWTGFYRIVGDDLVVGPYQGPLACMVLARQQGVCWASVNRDEAVLVADVSTFAGHIACDARSASEVVVPVRDRSERIVAVLDVDAAETNAFSETDVAGLSRIATLIHAAD